ncbi:diacylglycerol kinase [Rhodobacteraceae bacterium WD3A24]|nr:diacylglycerol kinase [Rhodobacteraceae bacterium WD3A24]
MRRILLSLAVLALAGAGGYWWLTRPAPLPDAALAGIEGDAERGERVFWAAGCAGCHAAEEAEGDAFLVLAGGRRFPSPFGTFVAPNISPDDDHGIGGWSRAEFASAVMRGVGPQGTHYFPAFPYTSYARAEPRDIADLWAFMRTLPASDRPNEAHDVGFPFGIRRNLGLWKTLFLREGWVIEGPLSEQAARGRYLVEALGHCAECHTPRNAMGGLDTDRWLTGAPNPAGDGRVPDITPSELGWSADEIADYLSSGFTPEFDVAGGAMGEVIDSLANLPEADLAAIAAYLTALPE